MPPETKLSGYRDSSFYTEEERKYYEEEKDREKEQRKELIISDKFWDLLQKKMNVALADRIGNPEYLRIVFKSQHPSFKKTAEILITEVGFGENEVYINGKFFVNEGSIHFNLSLEEIEEKFPSKLAEVISHELVHYVQDLIGKYPEMGRKVIKGVDKDSPWEEEAYRLQGQLKDDFDKECEII